MSDLFDARYWANACKALANQALALKTEVRTLNEVIKKRKRSTRRLHDYMRAVKQLHRPWTLDEDTEYSVTVCKECCTDLDGNQTEECSDWHQSRREHCWPCRTIDAIETARAEFVEGLKVIHGD